ncbi:DODA-type extradiol aromatic ring-opening family dioxygenase [Flavobacterium sp. W21_SRS_FM6]|uniref:DODA-type extradiol aromatic ring-opening family dioxygenase n=1 Tax=Flavobacterium sp. W21_SRS_FM6 TaxID=3240268 RepID=UPI003F8FB1F8
MKQARVLFLSHGGGPMPLLGDAGHQDMLECLTKITKKLPTPSSILVISAHWEEDKPTITSAPQSSLIYDYYGFPAESYTISYPCPGEPNLANQIHESFAQAGISSRLDAKRGLDHGVFVPLSIMYPQANIPCVQLSLVNNLDSAEHLKIGTALQQVDYDNLLVIGSGFSFHNMRAFFAPENEESKNKNVAFESWLLDTCSNPEINEAQRTQQLLNWQQAPFARYCHPREEHLLPLHVCYGLAHSACTEAFELKILNKKASMYLW